MYFKRTENGQPKWLHRAIWESAFGAIPPKHHIHHADENPFNNALENLVCVLGSKHLSRHGLERWESEGEKLLESLEKARAAAPIWHTQHRVLGEIMSSASRKLAELDAARAAQAASGQQPAEKALSES